MIRRLSLAAALLIAAATAAHAHTGVGSTAGLAHGFVHPLGGIDHVLVMVAVGLFAVHLGGRALWLVPLSFISMMILGGAFGMAGIGLPFAEIGIGLSVVVLGLAVAFEFHLPTAAAMALVGLFAIFHGHAHGAEMPETVSGLAYGAGFGAATVLLHAAGIGIGLGFGRIGAVLGRRALQTTGGAMALAGVVILAGYL